MRDNVGTSAGSLPLGFRRLCADHGLWQADRRSAGSQVRPGGGAAGRRRAAAAGMAVVLTTTGQVGAIAGFALYGAGALLHLPADDCPGRQGQAETGPPVPSPGSSAWVTWGCSTGPVMIGGLASVAGLARALILPAALALAHRPSRRARPPARPLPAPPAPVPDSDPYDHGAIFGRMSDRK